MAHATIRKRAAEPQGNASLHSTMQCLQKDEICHVAQVIQWWSMYQSCHLSHFRVSGGNSKLDVQVEA